MMQTLLNPLLDLMQRGGLVMWPLLAVSVVGLTMVFERSWFWLRHGGSGQLGRVGRLARMLREGRVQSVRDMVADDRSVYGRILARLLEEGATDAVAMDAVESQRPRLERFMATLSTLITAAPMLGILGTVTGIISSFQILGAHGAATDPTAVSQGIAEALLTTAAGLLVALTLLLPYNAFRARLDRALGRIEALVASVRAGTEAGADHEPTLSAPDSPSATTGDSSNSIAGQH